MKIKFINELIDVEKKNEMEIEGEEKKKDIKQGNKDDGQKNNRN